MSSITIASYNVNGIRAAIKKGFLDWLAGSKYEIVHLQEVKAEMNQIDVSEIEKLGYHVYWNPAEKKGYSGVATFSKMKADEFETGCGIREYDSEGRIIRLQFGKLMLINTYFPSGTSGDIRQDFKMKFLADYSKWVEKLKKKNPDIIISGDVNIAHHPIDIHDPVGNKNSSGFLPDEREWLTQFLHKGWLDTLRVFNQSPHLYSWWSQRFPTVRLQNKGWRLDYHFASEALKKNLLGADILPSAKHSDHCPVVVRVNLP